MNTAIDHARHTPYANPGRHADLVAALPADPESLSAVARNVIVHYRASGEQLPDSSRHDIDARWLESILDLDQSRHPRPLDHPRAVTERVQGCCRDHTLFCVGALRSRGIPARSRVGYVGYFVDGWHHDHVIVEAWLDGRWRRFDPEVADPRPTLPSPMDIPRGELGGTGFVTAAEVWIGFRRGELDPSTYGVGPEVPGFRGERFVFDEVIHEVAHRFGDELLLWDGWGRIGEPDEPVSDEDARWLDEIAQLLVAADDIGTGAEVAEVAEVALLDRYRRDPGLHPGAAVMQASPYGDPPVVVQLRR